MVIIKKKYNEIRVDVLMVLCHILDDFEDFRSSEYIKSYSFDYTLVEDKSGEVPLEALHIAELLGVNNDLIDKAKKLLKY